MKRGYYYEDEPDSGLSMSIEAFEAMIDNDNRHFEMIGGEAYAMAEPTIEHKRIASNFERSFIDQLGDSSPCRAIQNYPVAIPDHATVKPDVVLTCDRSDWSKKERAQKHHRINSPLIVIEILSPSTEEFDRSEKFARYQSCQTLEVYMLVNQYIQYVEVYRRETGWKPEQFTIGQTIHLDQLDLEFPLDEIYAGVFED